MTFKAGINIKLFNALKKTVSKMQDVHQYCLIMFEEISISANLKFNVGTDEVGGFVDNGFERLNEIAGHAFVFMVSVL